MIVTKPAAVAYAKEELLKRDLSKPEICQQLFYKFYINDAEANQCIEQARAELTQQSAPTAEVIELDPPKPAYERFLAVAMRAHARGQRVLPIAVGGKNPLIAWKGSVIDTDTTEQWREHSEQWIKECAEKFPDAAACVIAKPFEYCFIDEDSSDEFRAGYEEIAGDKFPRTFTTESRPNHRQSHWLQTDATRALSNVPQMNGLNFSFRQHNYYVLSEGSPHPSGTFYHVVDDTAAIPMPAKLVEYIEVLKKQADERERVQSIAYLPESEASGGIAKGDIDVTPNGLKIPRGEHDNTLTRICGKIHRNEPDLSEEELGDRLEEIAGARLESPGSDWREMCRKIAHSIGSRKDEPVSLPLTSGGRTAEEIIAQSQSAQAQQPALVTADLIDANFPRYDGKPSPRPRMLIDGFLMGGVNFFGSLSGVGKSWTALAVAKALVTGEALFGVFPVKEKTPVLYLIPESDDSDFKYRLGVMRMPQNSELFRYRTISQGQTLRLTNDLVLAAIKQLHHDGKYPRVLVIVDTAVRFMLEGKDMSSATNNNLSHEAEVLQSPEVQADILFLHHSPKAASKADLTLENTLRDTGDFGAMSNCVWALQRDEKLFDYGDGPEEMDMINVKFRGPDKPQQFRLRLKRAAHDGENEGRPVSVIDELGTLECVGAAEHSAGLGDRLDIILRSDPNIGMRALKDELRLGYTKIKELAATRGWKQVPVKAYDSVTRATKKHFVWTQIGLAGVAEGKPVAVEQQNEADVDFDAA